MYLIGLCVFILRLDFSISLFPKHMDFQKVGEIIFNNEKYKVLKPAAHSIVDYFFDQMTKQDVKTTQQKETGRIFLDNEGFRHFWSGFGVKTTSLRKTDVKNKVVAKNKAAKLTAKKIGSKDNGKVESLPKELNDEAINKGNLIDQAKGRRADGGKTINATTTKAPKADGIERNVVETTFFCPFLGIITMSAFVD